MKTIMKPRTVAIGVCFALLALSALAQDIGGTWQGTLAMGPRHPRVILKIEKAAEGGWAGKFYAVDQFSDWGAFIPTSSITLQGAEVRFAVTYYLDATYQGKLSADGKSIEGTWTQGEPQPLRFDRATADSEWKDPSPHKIQFVAVDKEVKLEVLDFGGSGRPLVLLAGGGSSGHMFDSFALKLTGTCHVYAITRRGFGASSAPATGYDADRLGDDVVAVLDALKLERPVLAGLSVAGEELSSVGSRHAERVAGLIYLDAGYSYAYYDSARGDIDVDIVALRDKLEQFKAGKGPADLRPVITELLEKDLPGFERDLREMQKDLAVEPSDDNSRPVLPALQAIFDGFRKYARIPVPILNIYAIPHDLPGVADDPKVRAAMEARELETNGAQADAFAKSVPTARVVRWPHYRHNLIVFHEADVLREMNAFLAGLR